MSCGNRECPLRGTRSSSARDSTYFPPRTLRSGPRKARPRSSSITPGDPSSTRLTSAIVSPTSTCTRPCAHSSNGSSCVGCGPSHSLIDTSAVLTAYASAGTRTVRGCLFHVQPMRSACRRSPRGQVVYMDDWKLCGRSILRRNVHYDDGADLKLRPVAVGRDPRLYCGTTHRFPNNSASKNMFTVGGVNTLAMNMSNKFTLLGRPWDVSRPFLRSTQPHVFHCPACRSPSDVAASDTSRLLPAAALGRWVGDVDARLSLDPVMSRREALHGHESLAQGGGAGSHSAALSLFSARDA
jgi:hypothetical protein|eukprot:3964729-Prymnesium_polylepis.1